MAPVQEIDAHQLFKALNGNEIWSLSMVRFCPATPSSLHSITIEHDVDPNAQIDSLLHQFKDVFDAPCELPPHRDYDHAIPLKPDAVPVNARPYKYSPLHKTEIERQVTELLAKGLITHSTSPFASPVLLVQKRMVVGAFVLISES